MLGPWYTPRKFLPNWTGLYQSSLKGEVQNQKRNQLILKNLKMLVLYLPQTSSEQEFYSCLQGRSDDKVLNIFLKIFVLRLQSKYLDDSVFVFSFPLGFLLGAGDGHVPPSGVLWPGVAPQGSTLNS